jgi:hypothetical protein
MNWADWRSTVDESPYDLAGMSNTEEADAALEGTGLQGRVLVLRAQIRFALHQLSPENGASKFERMCRFLARMTVTRNLLPATGPVQSGGDQGRDAETYQSDLPGQTQEIGRALGVHDGDGVAIACTLQQERVLAKFREDVASIMASGTPVRFVVAYCEANIAVGPRHRFQTEMAETHGIHVEVFDGEAITELLIDRARYWIAREFLDMPLAAFPAEESDRPQWYEDDLARWHELDAAPRTMGDLTDLSGCVRYATFHKEAREDLEFWISRLEYFLREGVSKRLRNDACYEIAVAHLRGYRDMQPVDPLVTEFVEENIEGNDPAALEDVGVLVSYTTGAIMQGVTSHTPQQADAWCRRLIVHLERLLKTEGSPGTRCKLLATLVFSRLQLDLRKTVPVSDFEVPPETRLQDAELDPDVLMSIDRLPFLDYPMIDRDGVFAAWEEILVLASGSPLFPLEGVAEVVQLFSNVLAEDHRFDAIAVSFDERIGEERGEVAKGDLIRDRAMEYYRGERILEAVRDLHRVLLAWFTAHAATGLFLVLRFTATVYGDHLRLYLANKQYALIAARHVPPGQESEIWRALAEIARADFHQGAWFSAVDTGVTALRAYEALAENPWGSDTDGQIGAVLFELVLIRDMAMMVGGEHQTYVERALMQWNTDDQISDIVSSSPKQPWWAGMPLNDLLAKIELDLGHPAFSDGGEQREIAWSALGVTWRFQFYNSVNATLVAERLVAAAQILAADLALRESCMWPTQVTIEVRDLPPGDPAEVSEDGYEERGRRWRIALPLVASATPTDVRTSIDDTLGVLVPIFLSLSALSDQDFGHLFEEAIEGGLIEKLCLGTIYDIAYDEILRPTSENMEARRRCEPLGSSNPPEGEALAFPARPGPGFSLQVEEAAAARMYEIGPQILHNTLPRLLADPSFRQVAATLKADGWLDRHILLAAVNLAQNRHHPTNPDMSFEEMREVGRRHRDPEPTGQSIDPAEFTEEELRSNLQLSQASTANAHGLDYRVGRLDSEAVSRLLGERYGYWTIDVPHVPLIPEPDPEAA